MRSSSSVLEKSTAIEEKKAPRIRCAVYTRKSTEEGLEQEFNSLDAQRESAEAYIASQKQEGWICLPEHYDDGGFTGANMERPALKRLMSDIEHGLVDCCVVYKVDRLSRSLMDFAKIIEILDRHGVSFVSVTQQFCTSNSMGRLTLNILLSFAQFEREIIAERTRDKISASRRKGKWTGGFPVLGYDIDPNGGKLLINVDEADRVKAIFEMFLSRQSYINVVQEINARGWSNKSWVTKKGHTRSAKEFDKVSLYRLLTNPIYVGRVAYRGELYEGEHEAIVDNELWDQVQEIVRQKGRRSEGTPRVRYESLLGNLLYCASCQSPMVHVHTTRKGTVRYRYYICSTAQNRGWDMCRTKSVSAPDIEGFVVDRIRCIGRDPGLIAQTIEEARKLSLGSIRDLEEEMRNLEKDLRKHAAEIRGVMREVGRVGSKGTTEIGRLTGLQEKIHETEQRMTVVNREILACNRGLVDEGEVAAALESFDPLWEVLTPAEKARVMHLLVERIAYDGEKSTMSMTFRPSGIKVLAGEMEAEGRRQNE